MAETTVVSMARCVLRGAISKAASAATAELSLVMGVQKDIWFIKDELKTMQAFLAAVEETKDRDIQLKVWAESVRDLSYNIEDCLDEFIVHVRCQSLTKRLMKLKDRRRIAIQIHNLKSRVEEVSRRNTRYNSIKMEGTRTADEVDSYSEDVRNHSASNINEGELVGFSKPKKELIKLMDLKKKIGPAKLICVVGMGGLGKTTLARKTYESKEDIMNNFSCCAWITVSQSFSKIEMVKDMITQLLGVKSLNRCLKKYEGKVMQATDLANDLKEELKDKRYFIVLDDLWTLDMWMWIRDINFPRSNNKGSRIVITTRDVHLAEECTSDPIIYHLKPLDQVDAINLLLRKSRKLHEDMEKYEDFRDLVERLVIKCGHLPLALLSIGGILATKKVEEWEKVVEQLPSELESNPCLENVRRIVTLSYNHLPSHLKSCFLYLSIFPKDWEIQMRSLVERWIGGGFVRARNGVKIEDVGKLYFNELINRGLIVAARVDIEGVVKSCRVHDIVRDVMVSISRDENFVYVARDNVPHVIEETFRHVSCHGSKCQNIDIDFSHTRSLAVFGERTLPQSLPISSPDLRMLRALDLEYAQFMVTQKDISNIGLLRHLKYVCFPQKYSYFYKLPRSIGKLQGLRTLDIRGSYITELPTEITKLMSLHSLRCSSVRVYDKFFEQAKECLGRTFSFPTTPLVDPSGRAEEAAELYMNWSSWSSKSIGVRVPRGIGNLKELQILEVVSIKRTNSETIKELGGLVQLKKLSVDTEGATEQKCKVLYDVIQNLTALHSLHLSGEGLEWLYVVSSPPPLLRALKLYGYLGEIPDWFRNLTHLVKLHLVGSQLKRQVRPMAIVGALPNLRHFRFESYCGETLVFRKGAFPNLSKLDISDDLTNRCLKEVKFKDGTSPHIERIEIRACKLESGITGITHLPSLKEISIGKFGLVANLAMLQGDVNAHPKRPVLLRQDDTREEATPEERPHSSDSQDIPPYTYNSCWWIRGYMFFLFFFAAYFLHRAGCLIEVTLKPCHIPS